MGLGQIGGNGSVEWSFIHHRVDGSVAALAHNAGPHPPNPDEVRVNGNKARGKDPLDFADIGTRGGLVPGHFKVTLSYASPDAAAAAKAAMTLVGNSLVVHVPAVDRRAAPGDARPKEVIVEW